MVARPSALIPLRHALRTGRTTFYVADGSAFVTSGAHNPTNTIMAVALRNMRYLARS